jgi:prepilin-type N-terminal cleavage/methylation domain-containing protein
MRIWRDRRGFTMTELLIALAGVGLVLSAVVSVQENGLRAYVAGSNRVEIQQNARTALDRMEREIREALAITTANASSITFTAQDGVTAVTYAPNGGVLERNGVALVGGVESLTFVYRGANDAAGASAANTRRIDITIRTRTEEIVAAHSAGDTKYQTKTSVQLRNAL